MTAIDAMIEAVSMGESTRARMPGRLLRLLSLLQSRREWSGTDLADRLDVSPRTLRRDIDRLRELDYPVLGTTGTAGGYRLQPGAAVPPLQLDDDEAIAIAIGLATGAGVAGIEESSLRALAKLQRMLPTRLRPRLRALGAASVLDRDDAPVTDPDTLALLAGACDDHEIVTVEHRGRDGAATHRRLRPHHLVTARSRWYLIALNEAGEWRTFRVDRLHDVRSTQHRFEPRILPTDPASYLRQSFDSAIYPYRATVTVGTSEHRVRAGIFGSVPGRIVALDDASCRVELTARSPELVVQYVLMVAALGATVTVDADPDVDTRLAAVITRLQ